MIAAASRGPSPSWKRTWGEVGQTNIMTDPDTQPAQQEAVEEKAEVKQVSIVVLDLHLVLVVLSMM